jgi:hypothetical protein
VEINKRIAGITEQAIISVRDALQTKALRARNRLIATAIKQLDQPNFSPAMRENKQNIQ